MSDQFESRLKKNISINIFLEDPISDQKIGNVRNRLKEKEFISSLQYIDKEKAAEQFISETGEDFRKILDYNPLPASFVLRVSESYAHSDSLNFIINELSGIEWVEEVVFREGFIYRLLNYIDSGKIYLFVATIIVGFIA